jgi:hypothetical protein
LGIEVATSRVEVGFAMETPDGGGVDRLLAVWTDSVMGRFRDDCPLAMLATDGVWLDIFLAERARTGRWLVV